MMNPNHDVAITRQAELLGIPRTGFYYQPIPIKPYDLILMKLIDEIHMDTPYLGSRRIRNELRKLNHDVGRLHVATLMRKMGIEAIYPKKRLSIPDKEHEKYPYLLKGLTIDRPNQVWATDITCIPMKRGYCYLTAVLDWHSRKVLSWRLSNTLDASFCAEALEEAISVYGRPEIFNTDQGSQFTSKAFTDILKNNEIRISMDGKGRWVDNVFVERLWRSVKYEEVYTKAYESIPDARMHLGNYFQTRNGRGHKSPGYKSPDEVYRQSIRTAA